MKLQMMTKHWSDDMAGHHAVVACGTPHLLFKAQYTIEESISLSHGLLAFQIYEGAMNGDDFCNYVEHMLIPNMGRFPGQNSILILDNASIHKQLKLEHLCWDAGVLLAFLPPYSPDLTPVSSVLNSLYFTYIPIIVQQIESSFFHIKQWLRRNKDHVCSLPNHAMGLVEACITFTPELADSCFRYAGWND
ncbi:hypothetical protein CcCBS67573_g05750 [Chytriomyces confervae]|uniref:Tc1-like transposase DDE domain-containing protein n=1 Tax=Chytriomyces confervae TaxID=246404 RepID=A0A507F8W4_9FUNG|nr:hypothetical protein CcCBS67573_g05750 [Chytriomyces confervae]